MVGLAVPMAHAAAPPGNFSLQVSPSPLVETLKPGTTKTLKLMIRNTGTATEHLKIEPRSFTIDSQTGKVTLDDTKLSALAPWISFSAPTFTDQPGQWYTQYITITLPKDTGFSYSLALVISRVDNPKTGDSGQQINGSVAVFTLINIDRPGAVRKLEVEKFTSDSGLYEYLPATFHVTFKNTGNTIVQPYGNIFVQRGANDKTPIATLPVNDSGGYILPGSDRVISSDWQDGFPVMQTTVQTDGSQKKSLAWDWSKLSHFRIGPYTAKLVAAYNDGQRDVPLQQELTFWVVPWRAISLLIVAIVIIGYLRHKQIERKTRKAVKRALAEHDKQQEKKEKEKVKVKVKVEEKSDAE